MKKAKKVPFNYFDASDELRKMHKDGKIDLATLVTQTVLLGKIYFKGGK